MADDIAGDACLFGSAGARRDDNPFRGKGFDLIDRDLVVTEHLDFQAGINLAEPLDKVVGERVVVVDQQDHALVPGPGS